MTERGVFLTHDELCVIQETVERWEQNPELITAWARRMAMSTALVLEKVIEKAGGRRAAQDISVAADRLAKVIDAMHKAGVFGQSNPASSQKQIPRKSAGGSTTDEPVWDPDGE